MKNNAQRQVCETFKSDLGSTPKRDLNRNDCCNFGHTVVGLPNSDPACSANPPLKSPPRPRNIEGLDFS
jgi:hypothetical protein